MLAWMIVTFAVLAIAGLILAAFVLREAMLAVAAVLGASFFAAAVVWNLSEENLW